MKNDQKEVYHMWIFVRRLLIEIDRLYTMKYLLCVGEGKRKCRVLR